MNSARRPRSLRISALIAAATVAVTGVAIGQSGPATSPVKKLELGMSYSRGDYGLAEDTEVLVVPASFVREAGAWVFRATMPWVYLTGPAALVANSGGGAGGPMRPNDDSTSGFGDALLALTYKLNPAPDGLHTDLTGRVKLPTGDGDRGLGTGEFDYYTQVDLYQTFDGTTPFMNAGYRVLGDGRYQLDDGFYASGGVAVRVADGTSVGGSVDWRQRIIAGSDDSVETTIFLFRRFSPTLSGTFYAQKGFTDASPDYGLGTSFSFSF